MKKSSAGEKNPNNQAGGTCSVRSVAIHGRHGGRPSNNHARSRSGVALIIVLAFIVLLTGLIVAFFSRTQTDRKLSNNSFAQAKAEQLALSAADIIIGDLKQEIVDGSNATTVGSGATETKIYAPKAPANMVPARSGNPGTPPFTTANPDPIPNMVRRSVRNDPIVSPGVASRASAVNSETDVSQNGRSISPARWNKHYLIPRATGANATDTTPVSGANGFTSPDWVFVTSQGPEVISAPSASVVGRYAYAIYDEGGLIDVNVAGYPSTSTANQTATKSNLAYANLTANGSVGLSTSAVDDLVGWRNYASVQPSGAFGGFTSSNATAYFNYVTGNTNGFLSVNNAVWNNRTDQRFLSRQQLLNYRRSTGFSANALQYLTHFSRALEQPSFAPNPNRPKITPSTQPPPITAISSYQGNNNYAGGDDLINLGNGGFLSVRVQNSFTRLNGQPATVGEPLVKTKFALSNLTSVSSNATASKLSTDLIYARFGIYRSGSSDPWVYDHGNSLRIMTLAEVAAANREPDFAELLKAAIHAGSLGKAAVSDGTPYCSANLQYPTDTSADVQILQIMANLIDQTKADNFPTRIQINDGNLRTVYGAKDLPYIYSWQYFGVTTHPPAPTINRHNALKVTLGNATTTTAPSSSTVGYLYRTIVGTSTDDGLASYLIIPTIWNPHDANTPAPASGPTRFRAVAETTSPLNSANYGKYWGLKVSPAISKAAVNRFDGAYDMSMRNAFTAFTAPPSTSYSTTRQLTSADALEFQFTSLSDLNRAFREPTLLWRNGVPTGMTLSGYSCTDLSTLSGKTYFGIRVADDCKLQWTTTTAAPSGYTIQTPDLPLAQGNTTWTTTNATTFTFRTSSIGLVMDGQVAGPAGTDNEWLSFRMEYWDGTQWIPYQEFRTHSSQWTGYSGFCLPVDPLDYAIRGYKNPFLVYTGSGTISNATGAALPKLDASTLSYPISGLYDPRTPRFGSPLQGGIPTLGGNATLDAITMIANSPFLPANSDYDAVGTSNFVLRPTMRPDASNGVSFAYQFPATPSTFGFSSGSFMGWFSQNSPSNFCYEDADGIGRRAMGGYNSNTSTTGLPLATAGNATYSSGNVSAGIVTPTSQSQSRPIILHRPFRSVAEMSYAFRGTPWKNIDFFTPESGDTALLDVFCVNEPPAEAMVAGKVNLNTRQAPVLQAILSGAYRDEWKNLPTPPSSGALLALTAAETQNVANKLIGITTASDAWRGPLTNISDLVGHFVPNAGSASGSDVYQYKSSTYAGLSGALDSSVYTTSSTSSTSIQRFRESAIRPLAACGQVRVWNLLIDVVAQTGRYPQSASGLSNFVVDGEKRYWVHVALDRFTGKIVDHQWEAVTDQ